MSAKTELKRPVSRQQSRHKKAPVSGGCFGLWEGLGVGDLAGHLLQQKGESYDLIRQKVGPLILHARFGCGGHYIQGFKSCPLQDRLAGVGVLEFVPILGGREVTLVSVGVHCFGLVVCFGWVSVRTLISMKGAGRPSSPLEGLEGVLEPLMGGIR